MPVTENWTEYVRRIAGNLTQAQIAKAMGGVSTSNIGRWIRGEPGQPAADNVIAFAKAFKQPPVEALRVAGYFTDDDVSPTARTPLTEYSVDELLEELRRRTRTE